jgi:hypothetical protein
MKKQQAAGSGQRAAGSGQRAAGSGQFIETEVTVKTNYNRQRQ